MNTKELRQAAEKVMSQKGSITNAAIGLARHILATVQEDDDEPVTEELIALSEVCDGSPCLTSTMITRYGGNPTSELCVVMQGNGGEWITIESCKTRGQFRALCKGLGIELKEAGK